MANFNSRPDILDDAARLRFISEHDPARDAIERFLQERYARAFGARLTEFMPWLVELRDRSDSLAGALGLRPAAGGPLFLERYLAAPAEQVVAAATGIAAARTGMVELGNLAAVSPGALRYLIVSLVRCLHGAGIEWALFTLLPSTRNAFSRLGLPLVPLAEARPDCLAPEARAGWGNYYERRPWVMAGHLAQGYRAIRSGAPQPSRRAVCGAAGRTNAWA